MAKVTKAGGNTKRVLNNNVGKGTTIGNGLRKTSTMNKHKRRNHKEYRGQGK